MTYSTKLLGFPIGVCDETVGKCEICCYDHDDPQMLCSFSSSVGRLVHPLSGTPSQELSKSVAGDFYISEESVALLERYYRAPDVRMSGGVMTARWQWPGVK